MALLLACADAETGMPTPRSAFDDPAVPVWSVEEQPFLTLGGSDEREGYYFDGIRGVVVLNDRIIVADGGAREVRFYNLEGTLVARSGRAGAGPGEFRSIGGLSSVGDTAVAVWDVQLARVTFLTSDGTLLRVASPSPGSARNASPAFVGSLPDGTLVFRDGMRDMQLRTAPTGERRDSIQILTESADGIERSMSSRGSETWFLNEGKFWGSTAVIFGRSAFQTVAGHRLVLAWNDSLEVASFAPDLTRNRAAVLAWRTRPVPEHLIAKAREALVDEAQQEAARGRMDGILVDGRALADVIVPFVLRQIESLPARTTEPAFAEVHGDSRGHVWLGQFAHPGTPEKWWLVLDSSLVPLGRLRVNADLSPSSVSHGTFVVVSTDSVGRELIALYRISDGT